MSEIEKVFENQVGFRRESKNMSAYYYSFDPTGNPEIDDILFSIASAGQCFHHTDKWQDHDFDGFSCVDFIQFAANKSQGKIKDLQELNAKLDRFIRLIMKTLEAIEEYSDIPEHITDSVADILADWSVQK